MSQTETTRQTLWTNSLARLDQLLTQAALHQAMADTGDVVEVEGLDYLTPLGEQNEIDLTDICDGQGYNMHKLADKKYLGWRRA